MLAPASFPKISNDDLTATASSVYSSDYPYKAIDGNRFNYWHAKTNDMDWLQVEWDTFS